MKFELVLESKERELQSMAMPEMYNRLDYTILRAKSDRIAIKRSKRYVRELNCNRSDQWRLIEIRQLYKGGGYRTIACLSPTGRLACEETLKRLYNASI